MAHRSTAEHRRLEEARATEAGTNEANAASAAGPRKWRRWGTYLPERQWGTVREDYSSDGEAWEYFPFDHASRRAYRWGDDGLLGLCDNRGLVCFSVALWNGADRDPQGAPLRPLGPRGQPRRGRQRALLVPGRDAHRELRAGALQVSAARVSLRRASRARSRGHARRPGAGDPRHRGASRATRTSTSSSNTPRPTSTTSSSASR